VNICTAAFLSVGRLPIMLPLMSSMTTMLIGWMALLNCVIVWGRPLSRISKSSRVRSVTRCPLLSSITVT
jgi:hypothetical protein